MDKNIEKNAQFHCDKHVVKMGSELGQMISTAYHVLQPNNVPHWCYAKAAYRNHPCSIWVRESSANFLYACKLGLAIYNEYQFRYNKPNNFIKLKNLLDNSIKHPIKSTLNTLTPFAQAMPSEFRMKNHAITAYRTYYASKKRHLFSWKRREVPYWIKK